MSFNEVKRCWPDVVWKTNKIGIKTEIWKTDIFKSPQRKSKLSAWLDTTWGNWLLVINQQLLSDVPVCVCGWVSCVCVLCTIVWGFLLFSSTQQCPSQSSIGLQHEMRASIQKGGFVLIPCLGRRTVPCQCLLIPWTHLAYYTGLSLSSTPP